MKIATWNVNSIRVRIDHVIKWIGRASPDILCLQELKTPEEEFPFEELREIGYHAVVAGQRTYNGVAIISKEEPGGVSTGLAHLGGDHPLNTQQRVISARYGDVRVICAYLPNGESVGSDKFHFKMDFFKAMREYLNALHSPEEMICLSGDFNVAVDERDLYNPDERDGLIIYSQEERAALGNIYDFGFEDCFRKHHEEGGRYSWWDYQGGMFWKDLGMRIDYIWATPPLAARCTACDIDVSPRRWKRPSDHTTVWAEFDI